MIAKIAKTLRYQLRISRRFSRNLRWYLRQPPARRPIFVIGCSRAGTTLVYKVLSESKEIGSLQRETHDFWAELHPLILKNWDTHSLTVADTRSTDRNFVSQYFYSHTGKSRWVDKNNQNGLCVPYLSTLYPDAHFVFIKRSPGDNINSLIEGWNRPEEFATWSSALPADVNIEGHYKRWCFFLAEGWRSYLDRSIEEVCAFQYRALNDAILIAKNSIACSQWVEVFYEDILRDPVETFRTIFSGCGLQFDERLARHCRTVLDIPYNAFSEIRVDKWRDGKYRDKVERALPLVRSVAKQMGYDEIN